jgi:OOP family OmpA-OmpF porin
MSKLARSLLWVALVPSAACHRTMILQEPTPMVITAQAPKRAPAPAPVIRDRIVVSEAIFFDTDKDTIRQDSTRVVDSVAEIIKAHPELVKIRIEGHTDNVGGAKFNLGLSQRRAAAVRRYLIERGVEAERLISEGYGDQNPIADNTTEQGRQRNRRVAFTILDRTDGGETVSMKEEDQ